MSISATLVKELRENQIKEAALKLFSDKGFHNTTIAQLAESSGLSKGTIYWYWKSKEDLAFSLFEDMLSVFLEIIETTLGEEGSFYGRYMRLAGRVADQELHSVDRGRGPHLGERGRTAGMALAGDLRGQDLHPWRLGGVAGASGERARRLQSRV